MIKHWDCPEDVQHYINVSAVDAGKMVLCAAPYAKLLDLTSSSDNMNENDKMYIITIGDYHYKVLNFKLKNV